MLPPISDEQHAIVHSIQQGCNVMVNAVAGSGKTTTSLYIASSHKDKAILLLTYNAKLKMETRTKVIDHALENMEVHSYHAFCVKYLSPRGYTDTGILHYLDRSLLVQTPPKRFDYDIVIVDEAQDMNSIYYRLVLTIVSYCRRPPQLVVMGDQKQSIYAFNKADARYLLLSPHVFPSPHRWVHCTLSISYRITQPMAMFINTCCQGASPITSIKRGHPVRYIICSTFGKKPFLEIQRYLSQGYRYHDIFVLAATVKSAQSPVRMLANRLSESNIPIYVPTSDEEKLEEDVLRNKIVFSTFHQVKGLERPIVLVFDFSANYFRYYAKQEDVSVIPNTLYVAITRAKEHLSLFHDDGSAYCPFLRPSSLFTCCSIEKSRKYIPEYEESSLRLDVGGAHYKELPVTELIKYIPVEMIHQCLSCIHIQTIHEPTQPPKKKLSLVVKSKQKDGLVEGVAEITSVAIPSYFEFVSTGKMTIYDHLQTKKMMQLKTSVKKRLLEPRTTNAFQDSSLHIHRLLDTSDNYIETLLKLSTEWVASKSGYHFKKSQIQTYDWLLESQMDDCMTRLRRKFPHTNHLQFEKDVVHVMHECALIGFVDIYNPRQSEIWELKMVPDVTSEHFLQVAVYMWMMQRATGCVIQHAYVFNIVDDQSYEISIPSMDKFERALSTMIRMKLDGVSKKTDEQFIKSCEPYMNKNNSSPHKTV